MTKKTVSKETVEKASTPKKTTQKKTSVKKFDDLVLIEDTTTEKVVETPSEKKEVVVAPEKKSVPEKKSNLHYVENEFGVFTMPKRFHIISNEDMKLPEWKGTNDADVLHFQEIGFNMSIHSCIKGANYAMRFVKKPKQKECLIYSFTSDGGEELCGVISFCRMKCSTRDKFSKGPEPVYKTYQQMRPCYLQKHGPRNPRWGGSPTPAGSFDQMQRISKYAFNMIIFRRYETVQPNEARVNMIKTPYVVGYNNQHVTID